jgi:hypothetical protein
MSTEEPNVPPPPGAQRLDGWEIHEGKTFRYFEGKNRGDAAEVKIGGSRTLTGRSRTSSYTSTHTKASTSPQPRNSSTTCWPPRTRFGSLPALRSRAAESAARRKAAVGVCLLCSATSRSTTHDAKPPRDMLSRSVIAPIALNCRSSRARSHRDCVPGCSRVPRLVWLGFRQVFRPHCGHRFGTPLSGSGRFVLSPPGTVAMDA